MQRDLVSLRRTKDFSAAFLLVVLRPGGPERRDWEREHFNSPSLDVAITRDNEVVSL